MFSCSYYGWDNFRLQFLHGKFSSNQRQSIIFDIVLGGQAVPVCYQLSSRRGFHWGKDREPITGVLTRTLQLSHETDTFETLVGARPRAVRLVGATSHDRSKHGRTILMSNSTTFMPFGSSGSVGTHSGDRRPGISIDISSVAVTEKPRHSRYGGRSATFPVVGI